jgi:hypothetical protein
MRHLRSIQCPAPVGQRCLRRATAPELTAEREFLETWLEAPPDKTLALIAEMDDITAPGPGPVRYACPMHPEVTGDEPGRCPECGMKLLVTVAAAQPRSPGTQDGQSAGHSHAGDGGGIEWEDDMVAVNRLTTAASMRWKLVDRATGAAIAAIGWRFTVGTGMMFSFTMTRPGAAP